MDYISRAEAKEAFRKWTVDSDELGGVLQVVDAIPAADVREVRRGRWIEDGEGYQICSECGAEHHWETYRASFCEDCGADMGEE